MLIFCFTNSYNFAALTLPKKIVSQVTVELSTLLLIIMPRLWLCKQGNIFDLACL